jgi:cytochrome P450 family 135
MTLPPGPRGPAVLQSVRLITSPIGYLERCLRTYGDVFTLRFVGMGNLVYVADPEVVKQIFTGDAGTFRAGEANEIMEPMLGSRSLLLLDEDEHLRERRLLLPPFHGERVRRYQELVAEIAAAEIERWPRGQELALRPRMQAITLEVILRAVFGIREAERLDRLRELLPKMLDHGGVIVWMPFLRHDLGPGSPWRRFLKVRAEVDRLLADEIARRREAPDLAERDDVLSMLLQACDEDGEPMSEGALRDELITLLLAGHETTATGLAWTFDLLLRHPRVLARLVAEVEAGEEEAYLRAVVSESLRLRPVVPLAGRRLSQELHVNGHVLPPGTDVTPAIWLAHTRPDRYPEPYAFRPERFLEDAPATYAWVPFGGGVRRCLGAAFAEMEMRVALAEILRRRTLRPASAQPERVARRNVTFSPRTGTQVFAAGSR